MKKAFALTANERTIFLFMIGFFIITASLFYAATLSFDQPSYGICSAATSIMSTVGTDTLCL